MSFFEELKRRNVFRVAIGYIITAWLLLQVVDLVLENINAPDWVMQVFMLALATGFPLAVFFAWAFEMTPEGLKREHEVDRTQSIAPNTGKKLNKAIFAMMALALTYFIWESRFQKEDVTTAQAGKPAASIEEQVLAEASVAEPQGPVIDPQSIAVLPFDNRSRLEEDEFFVEGVHDDLLTKLARIGSLKVISRTSVGKYKDTEKTIPEIASELGVATVMEGAVQRAGNTVRINVQLIDAITDEHLWAEIFDRELTTNNLFAIQTEISEKIAKALNAALSNDEQQQINRRPTDNMAAYQAYVRGRQSMAKRTSASLDQAMAEYRRAVELDPGFALAWVGISECARLSFAYGTLDPNEGLSIMEEAIEHALKLDPTLGEAYVSRAVVYGQQGQPEKAEESFLRAIELNPNYATAYHWYADYLRWESNRIEEALIASRKALELDPLSTIIRHDQGSIYRDKGDLDRAESLFLETLDLDPDFALAYSSLARVAIDRGRLDESFKWNQQSLRIDPGNMATLMNQYVVLIDLGLDEHAQVVLSQMEALDDQHFLLSTAQARTNVQRGRNAAALEHVNYLIQAFDQPWTRWVAGIFYATNGDYQKARELILSTAREYDQAGQWPMLVSRFGEDACKMAWVFMNSGDEELGRELLTFTLAYFEKDLPQYVEHGDRHGVASCYAALGDTDATLASMEQYLAHGHVDDWAFLRIWPPLQSLRDNPRFIEMDSIVKQKLALQAMAVEKMIEAEAS